MDMLNVFIKLGFKEDHLKIYLASLEWGETTISNLAYKSKVPRTTIYELIDDLINIGLIKPTLRKNKKLYTPEQPEKLITLLKNKEIEINDLISNLNGEMTQLKAIQFKKENKPKVHLLEGKEGIMQAYEMTFNAKEVLVQCFAQDYGDVPEDFMDDYFERFFHQSDIKSKEILAEGEDSDYIKTYGSGKNLQLRVPLPSETTTDYIVFDNTVIFVSFDKKNSYALVIEDEKIAESSKVMFNLAWTTAGQIDKRVQRGEKVFTEYSV